jgi:hypothetical protein
MNDSKKIAVWQIKKENFLRWLNGGTELRFPLEYECVAMVDAKTPEQAFALTNSIDSPWWENEGVECRIQSRSTSVGDVIAMPGGKKLYLCTQTGWHEFNEVPMIFPGNFFSLMEKQQ